jgi:hypothetical protein
MAEELLTTNLFSDPNLVAYYRFEGNANDSKGSFNGSSSNVTFGTSYGVFNQGGNFNGSSSKIDIASFFSAAVPNMTIIFWLQTTATSGVILQQRSIYSTEGQWQLRLSSGKINFWDFNGGWGFPGSSLSSSTVNNNAKNMIAFVKSGGTSGVYIS